jgi:phosphatidate phosphatase APP1
MRLKSRNRSGTRSSISPLCGSGDSGQKDPEIYLKIAVMYPSRVKVIYIRTIGSRKRNRRLKTLQEEAAALGTEMQPEPGSD